MSLTVASARHLTVPAILLSSLAPMTAAGQALDRYERGCYASADPMGSNCTAAVHRLCAKSGAGNVGLLQSVTEDRTGRRTVEIACLSAAWYGDAEIAGLRAKVPGCSDPGKAQEGDCVAAIHRWCSVEKSTGAGIAQELGRGVIGVGCVAPLIYQDVPVRQLNQYDHRCREAADWHGLGCRTAIQRWCDLTKGGSAGIAQEVGNGVVGVACLPMKEREHGGIGRNID